MKLQLGTRNGDLRSAGWETHISGWHIHRLDAAAAALMTTSASNNDIEQAQSGLIFLPPGDGFEVKLLGRRHNIRPGDNCIRSIVRDYYVYEEQRGQRTFKRYLPNPRLRQHPASTEM